MYDISKKMVDTTLLDYQAKIGADATTIIAGAFIKFTRDPHATPPSTPLNNQPIHIQSGGVTYSGNSKPAQIISNSTISQDKDLIINFTFYKKYETKLAEDVSGSIYYQDYGYVLEIFNQIPYAKFLPHTKSKWYLKERGPLTLGKLREIMVIVRTGFLLLPELDKMHDVYPFPSTNGEKDSILAKIKEYLTIAIEKGFMVDDFIKSSTDIQDAVLVDLQIRKMDGSKAEKDLVNIELFRRAYEPFIRLRTYFENDDPITGSPFTFLDKNKEPYVIDKSITMDEADYFIRGIFSIMSTLPSYKYVTDVTP